MNLQTDYTDAYNTLLYWKHNNGNEVYLHRKIVTNIVFRAYCTYLVYEDYLKGKLADMYTIDDAIDYIEEYYFEIAKKNHDYLMDILCDNGEFEVGTVSFYQYKRMAYEAEHESRTMRDLEFSYLFEHLNDLCILYLIAYCLTGKTIEEAFIIVDGHPLQKCYNKDYKLLKECFQDGVVANFITQNYVPLS